MRQSKISNLLLVASLLFCGEAAADSQLDIWEKLKSGGLVILMSHAAVLTDSESNTSLTERDASCKTERPLSNEGKNQAVSMGRRFKSRSIPIVEILNSPYCRTSDTASLAFNINHATEYLRLWIPLSKQQADDYLKNMVNKISQFSGSGNLVLITHSPNISAISFEDIVTGTALVVQPKGNGEFEELGKIDIF